MSQELVIENGGKINLPRKVLEHFGLKDNTRLRVIETDAGILLVPLTDAPLAESLRAEIAMWQGLGAESL